MIHAFIVLNLADEIAKKIQPLNDNSYHIIYAFMTELAGLLGAIFIGFKYLTHFMNPNAPEENKSTTRDIVIIMIFAIIGFIFPVTLMFLFWYYTHNIWWWIFQIFSFCIAIGFIRFVLLMRKLSKILNENSI